MTNMYTLDVACRVEANISPKSLCHSQPGAQ